MDSNLIELARAKADEIINRGNAFTGDFEAAYIIEALIELCQELAKNQKEP